MTTFCALQILQKRRSQACKAQFQCRISLANARNFGVEISSKWTEGLRVALQGVEGDEGRISPVGDTKPGQLPLVYFLPPRRDLPDSGPGDSLSAHKFMEQTEALGLRNDGPHFAPRLRAACKNRKGFEDTLFELMGEEIRIRVEGTEIVTRAMMTQHRPSGLGSGPRSLVQLAIAFFDTPDGTIVVIDEPELSLHPALQKRLLQFLVERSSTSQIIYATHSPHLISWTAILNGGVLARVFRTADAGCIIRQPARETIQQLEGLLQNVNNPHILDVVAREVFFLPDQVILVEGQEDVHCYRKIEQDLQLPLGGEFFGWGIGGAGNMVKICNLLKELGYLKVAAILDKNMESGLVGFREEFKDFHFLCIPADNVRDKKDKKASKPVRGLCDTDGNIHKESRHDVRRIFKEINNYLSG